MLAARGNGRPAQRQLILSWTQTQHSGIAYDHRRVNYLGVPQSFSGAHVRNVVLTRQLNNDLLPGYLPESGVVVNGDSVSPDNSRDGDVIFNDGENLRVAETVAGHLCLSEPLAVSRQHPNSGPDA